METEILTIAMLGLLGIGVFSGFPVALVLTATGFLAFVAAVVIGVTDFGHLGLIYLRVRGMLTNEGVQFTSVPLLIFLGLVLNASGVAATLFQTLGHVLKSVPGRYAIATLLIGLILAPAAGVIGASVVTVALVAYGPMLRSGYAPSTAGSAVAASGALGVVFPPAVLLFFVANVFQLRIALMYTALVIPVLLLVLFFSLFYAVTLRNRVDVALSDMEKPTIRDVLSVIIAIGVIAAIPLSIVGGIATLSEAAGIGVFGGLLVMAFRGRMTFARLNRTIVQTASMTSMVFFIVVGASIFSLGFNLIEGREVLLEWINGFDLGRWMTLALLLGIILVLGFVFDWIEILLVFFPILLPAFGQLDFSDHVGSDYFSKIWLAGLIALALQTSFLTPPFGYALFFAKMAAPPGVNLADIYRGAGPLVIIEILLIAVLALWPELITWLPELVLSKSDSPLLN
ncbi:C4-dicarboxylate TRAP transporter large permease protein DctM (plasmid) [Antarctobacter heliothermus]|uniref:C4-dicarboxylate TRAP transporter large permease protein DctM n=1 Tax=Antarctobacter heliothermus TaxID=74033 RepID=A0A222EBN0_9RHOB|nr:C4-dicarboxylate TRAP transporter large permease protein DctM [Antarctobacter heliothermus]|tara:strand:+ start:1213 stop:2580 length:1368 start_codon:yes stop_codon:yes gene_type:complete